MAVDVLTSHNDNLRTGANLFETALTPATVNPAGFGKLGGVAVDGQIYTQPLVKTGVEVPGRGTRDVVFVATEHDSVYAFDADTLEPLWHDRFINPAAGVTPVANGDVGTQDLKPEIGITGTPVIDPVSGTLYVVSDAKYTAPTGQVAYNQQLHALDLATGAEKLGGPVNVQASVRGVGTGSVRGRLAFDPRWESQRAALLLSNGVVYVGYGSFADMGPYHGWLLGYDARTLRQTSAFNVTPNGLRGGIWMSGGGPSADLDGSIFVATGNGSFRPAGLRGDFSDSVLKLSPVPGRLNVADHFTPSNQRSLQARDLDLGSGGVLLLPDQPGPHPHLLVTGGKEGRLYLIDRDRMGRFARRNRTVQEVAGAMHGTYGTPAYYNGTFFLAGTPPHTETNPGGGDSLTAFTLTNGRIDPNPRVAPVPFSYPGTSPSVSADGTTGGVLWALDNGAYANKGPAVLRSFDARDITRELFNSSRSGAGDQAGPAVKFATPTVANGKVYVGGNGTLSLYGLRRALKPGV